MKRSEAELERGMYALCMLIVVSGGALALMFSGGAETAGGMTGAFVLSGQGRNISREDAEKAISNAERIIEKMKNDGLGVNRANDLLTDAKEYFEGKNYTALINELNITGNKTLADRTRNMLEKAQIEMGHGADYAVAFEKAEEISSIKSAAYELKDRLRAAEILVISAEEELNVSEARALIENAKIEFRNERFENADALIIKIEPAIETAKAENTMMRTVYRAGRETVVNFIRANYIRILLFAVLVVTALMLSYRNLSLKMLETRLSNMKIEKKALEKLMRKAQTDYYAEGAIPKSSYLLKMDIYKKRISEIKRGVPVVRNRIKTLLRGKDEKAVKKN
jgi:hypothetical protein